jgi:Cysteine rich repeat
MGTPRSATPLCSIVIVAGLLMVMPYAPDRAYSAEPPQGQPKSSQSEPSPEEAAGGAHNLQLMRKACDEDVKKLCPDIRPGGGRILQCLRGQESNLSPSCRQVLAPRSSKP